MKAAKATKATAAVRATEVIAAGRPRSTVLLQLRRLHATVVKTTVKGQGLERDPER